jgi:ribosomal protein L31E
MMEDTVRLNLGKVRGTSRKKKANKAVSEVRRLVTQRTGADDVRVSPRLNEALWDRGASGPPSSVDVQLLEYDDHVRVEPADVELEQTQEDVSQDEQADDEPADDETGDEDDRTFDAIPEDVRETLREGTIDEGKEAVQAMNKADFEVLLNFEEKHKDRKGMKAFLRSNMR